jgi:hypothetical protein
MRLSMRRGRFLALAAACAALAVAGTLPASAAKCTKLDFTVNDYGKDGPTRDAKKFLEQKIVAWTRRRGIKSYTVTNRDVSCKLFLNLIVVDEHTCTASAQVCWTDGPAAPAAR